MNDMESMLERRTQLQGQLQALMAGKTVVVECPHGPHVDHTRAHRMALEYEITHVDALIAEGGSWDS